MTTACITFNPAEMTETVTSTHTALSILMTENVNKEKAFTNMYQMQTPTPMMNKIMNNSKEEKITGVTSEILKQIMKNQEQFNHAIVNFLALPPAQIPPQVQRKEDNPELGGNKKDNRKDLKKSLSPKNGSKKPQL